MLRRRTLGPAGIRRHKARAAPWCWLRPLQICAATALFAALLIPAAPAQTLTAGDRPPRGGERTITAMQTTQPPVIDGYLDDEAWLSAEPSTDFWVTLQQVWPQEQTEVMVMTDDRFIYVGMIMYDSQPDKIRAIETVRDRSLGFDDQVVVEINSSGNHNEISRFSVNARGTQKDAIAGGRARRVSWKGDWNVAVAPIGNGWVAEFAIPFEMLDYPAGTKAFNINFARYQHRTLEWSRWADVTPQSKPEEMGLLTAINPPSGATGKTWTFMPFVLAGKDVVDREGDLEDSLFTGGMDIRYSPNSDTTGVLAINPDFTQVETQIESANFSYNEKAVADPRVFFQEGSDYFGDDLRFFYSPRIPDFVGGGKMYGQKGAMQYGGFVAASPDDRWDAVARMIYGFNQRYSTSLIVNATDREDLEGAVAGLSAEGRQLIGTYWNIDAGMTSNRRIVDGDKQDTEDGYMYTAQGGWQGDYWGVGVTRDDYDKDFIPANGLIAQDRLGTNAWDGFITHYRNYGTTTISESTFDIVRTLRKTDDGRDQYDGWYAGGSLEWLAHARTGLSYSKGDYRPLTGDAPGDFGDTVTDDHFWTASLDMNTRGSRIGYGGSYSSGELGGGDYDYTYGYLWSRPTYNTSLSLSVERLESFGIFRQYIAQAGWDITPFDNIVFRYIDSGGENYWRFGYRRVVRSGLDIFALYDDEPFTEDPAISVKLLWTIN